MTMLLIPIYAFINRLWGSGWFTGNKVVATILSVVVMIGAIYLTGHGLENALILGSISGALYMFGRAFGFDVYFCCFNPSLFNRTEIDAGKGMKWISNICDKIVPGTTNQSSDVRKRTWGFVGMTWRGFYHLPQILVLEYINPAAYLVLSIFVLVHGLVYAVQYYLPQSWWIKQRQIPIAEYTFGAVLGLLRGSGL